MYAPPPACPPLRRRACLRATGSAVGGTLQATVYRCGPGTALTALQIYEDSNVREREGERKGKRASGQAREQAGQASGREGGREGGLGGRADGRTGGRADGRRAGEWAGWLDRALADPLSWLNR